MNLKGGVQRIWSAVIGSRLSERMIFLIAKLSRTDLLTLAYTSRGVLKSHSMVESGESHFIRRELPKRVRRATPLVVDVGAHEGEYAAAVADALPHSRIIACEPNPCAYEALVAKLSAPQCQCLEIGLSSENGRRELYTSATDPRSTHSSLHGEVFRDLHGSHDAVPVPIVVRTLDSLADECELDFIDCLKIDVEGHELQVLAGATRLLAERRIGIIQFEFNEMNIVARTWLRDFYELLPRHEFFRLDTARLIPLGPYSARNEIFHFQNIVAIPKDSPTE